MKAENLERAVEIKEEIDRLRSEINILPKCNRRPGIWETLGAKFTRNWNGMYILKTYTICDEIIKLDIEDLEILKQIRVERLEKLIKELEDM